MSMIDARRLNRQVVILQRSEQKDPKFNTTKIVWLPLATVWANVLDMLPSRAERIADGIDVAQRPCRIRMRYRTDIDSTMHLRLDGRELRIVAGPSQLGRREGIELVAEELTTGGQEP